ncbi:TraY domain-containing protein [Shewanella sp. SM34]|uniref:TraY domain-containing protein n=1 Tax=unclassified Shewanella TaxID=196818 RepID=UPI0021DB42A9|nr:MULTISPECIES: TraY domain-containing protein [unclassified Shewanella]MCU8058041.1 TraY domain-containing protein [Shewanella sp. SM35]MCU8066871.1 TraY domain-containing protein [Shewanella sp. SM34]
METKPSQVNVKIDARSNEILTRSAKENKRSKRSEASLRLSDHLNRFEDLGMALKDSKR